jgi:pimeloyl-ACP methyl ester carboxylesterase
MKMPVYPTIIVPGITASYFLDEYTLPPDVVWSVLTKNYERTSLHPDDLTYEAVEPARIVSGQVFEVAYNELINELRYNLRVSEDLSVPVFPFSYDWRQPIETAEDKLSDFIKEVISRTKLLRHYDKAGYGDDPKVNLIGHSMGGLVITGYLQKYPSQKRIHKVVTLATPFQGSFEPIIKVITGTADLGESAPSSREREAARLTPALYQLMPSFRSGFVTAPGLPETIFDPNIWQPSIIKTIEEYLRLYGLGRSNRKEQARSIFTHILESASYHRRRIDRFELSAAGLNDGDWLCIVGVNAITRVQLKVVKRGNIPQFQFSSSDRKNEWGNDNPVIRRMTGDGTVPFEGALPKFLDEKNIICLTPEDYGYWEVQDRLVSTVAGFHGILPNMDMIHRLIVVHLSGRNSRYGNIWGRRAPGVSEWSPPISNLKEK